MTLGEALNYLEQHGLRQTTKDGEKPYTLGTLKKACDRKALKCEQRQFPIAHRVTTPEWLLEWHNDKSAHRRGRRWDR